MTNGLLLEGADLIDGTGAAALKDAMVVLQGDRIVYTGPRTARFDTMPLRRLSLAGKTLIPGLIDAHTHAVLAADMRAYIKNGVTTIRFAGYNQPDVAALRGSVERGECIGPHILSCGPMIDQPPPAYPEWTVPVETAQEAAMTAKTLIETYGIEFLILTQRVTAPVMQAVIETAHAHGRSVVAQTWAVDGKTAALLGIDEIHNSSRVYVSREYPEERLLNYVSIADRLALSGRAWATIDWDATRPIMEAMIERGIPYCGMQVIGHFQEGIGVADLERDVDFLTLFGREERELFLRFLKKLQGSWGPDDWENWKIANRNRMDWMHRFHALGGKLMVGTDMQFGGIMLHHELRNIAALGFSPMEVIAIATSGNSRELGMENTFGTITEGLRADIVVLNRDPSADLAALRDIAYVIKGGAVVWTNP